MQTLYDILDKIDFATPISVPIKEKREEQDVKSYEKAIRFFADNKSEFSFSNSGKAYAKIVMSNIFRTAKNYIWVFSGDLNSFSGYMDQLEEFLKNTQESSFRIIFENYPESEDDKKLLKRLEEYKKRICDDKKTSSVDRIQWRFLAKDSFSPQYKDVHMTIADDRIYREVIDLREDFAKVCFNDRDTVLKLKQGYQILWEQLATYL